MPILSLLFFVLMTAGVAHGGWNAGGTSMMLSHPTSCPTAGYTAGYLQQCVDLDDGKLWTCGQSTGCVLAGQWVLNSAVATAGVTTFNARAGVVVPTPGDYTAAQVTNTPAGTIAAVTVQAALNELDAEKQVADGDLTTLAAKTPVGTGTNIRFTTGAFIAGNDITSDASGNLIDAGTVSGSVANDLVTNAKLANMATATIKGRVTAGTGDPEDLTVAQAQALLDIASKTVLATSGTINQPTNLVDWTQLKNVPAGFADGSDDGGGGGGGTGDVVGPASATDNALARFDTTTGKLLQNSPVTADDTGNLSTAGALTVGVGSPAAGFLTLGEGTAPVAASANTLQLQAPVDITTGYDLILPAAPSSGVVLSTAVGGVATLSIGNVTDALVPNNITIDLATAATALAANGSNCSAGNAPLGVDTTGAVENCFDVLTQAEFATFSAALAAVGTINTGSNPVDWSQLKNVPAGFADGVDAGGGAGSGDVVGPASAVDNAIARFDTTTGKLLQSSGVTIDDSGNISTPGTITAGAGGSSASTVIFNEGTPPSAAAANTIQLEAPPDVTTAYDVKLPPASATGFLKGTNVANMNSLTFVDLGAVGTLNAGGNPIDWSQLKNVPSGFADGTDDGGGTGVTVPLVLLPTTNGSDTLTIQSTGPSNRVRIGTKTGDPATGAIYFDATTASATNYALSGTSTATQVNAVTSLNLQIGDVTKAQINTNGLLIAAGGFIDVPDIAAPATPGAGFSRVYKKTSGTVCEKNSAGVETCMGGTGTLTAPATLTAAVDGPAQLTIRDNGTTNRLRFGTKFGAATIGAIYFDNTTASALNYGLSGTSTTTNINASTSVFFATSDTVRGLADAGGITTASQFRFQYGTVDVALQRASAGVVEVNNTTAGQNAPLITGLRDTGTTTLGTALTLRRQSSNTPDVGLGTSLLFQISSSTTANQDAGRIDTVWEDATHASRTAKIDVNLMDNATMTRVATFNGSGLQLAAGEYLELPDISSPAAPAGGLSRVYKKTGSTLCEMNSVGVETCLGAGTSAQTLQDVVNLGSHVGNASSLASAVIIGTDDGDGNFNEAGENGIALYNDAADGPQIVFTKDAHRVENIPNTFAKIWKYNGTEAMRLDGTTLSFNSTWRPLKSIEVPGKEIGSATFATAVVATNKNKVDVVTVTASTGDGIDFDFMSPDNWDAGVLKVKLNGYSVTTPTPSGNIVFTCYALAVSDGDTIPDKNTTGGATVTLGTFGVTSREEAATSGNITVQNTPAAGDHIYGHCNWTSNTTNIAEFRLNAMAKVYFTTTKITE